MVEGRLQTSGPGWPVDSIRANIHFQRIFSVVSICGRELAVYHECMILILSSAVQFAEIYQMLWADHLPLACGGICISVWMAPRHYMSAEKEIFGYKFGNFLAHIVSLLYLA